MNLNPSLLAKVVEVLRSSGAVPMPGGHGVVVPGVRLRDDIVQEPGVAERCFVCLCLLANGDLAELDSDPTGETARQFGERRLERRTARHWAPFAKAWFDLYGPALAPEVGRLRLRYLLDAMAEVAQDWLSADEERRDRKAVFTEWCKVARRRVADFETGGNAPGIVWEPRADPVGMRVPVGNPSWGRAVVALSDDRATQAQAMYFLHVLHSTLGVAQHSPDKHMAARREFYGRLRAILQAVGTECSLCQHAQGIANALGAMAMLNPPGEVQSANTDLASDLPECFQPASPDSRPPERDLAAAALEAAPLARDRLLAAHDLAEAVVDLLMDPLRKDMQRRDARGPPCFTPGSYSYLAHQAKDERRRFAAASGPQLRSDAVDDAPSLTRPMSRRFAEWMEEGGFFLQAEGYLSLVGAAPSAVRPGLMRCALCHAQQPTIGR